MSNTAGTAIAVLAALGASGAFGVAAALQHRQAQLAPQAGDCRSGCPPGWQGGPAGRRAVALAQGDPRPGGPRGLSVPERGDSR